MPLPMYDVDVTLFGVKAYGSIDNVTALMKMRSDLAGPGKPHYRIHFPSGTILSSNPRWMYNIVSYEIIGGGDGTVFRSIYSGSNEAFQRPFFNGDIWQTNTLAYTGGGTYTNSHLFNTVAAGSRIITCTNIADAANYVAGNRILLWGYDVVGNGYPPGTLYNEWHEIESVNNSTGVITLTKALDHNYDSLWWDVPNIIDTGKNSGKPRITLLDRADYIYPRYCGFNNVTFGAPLTGAAHASGTCQIIGDTVEMENVVIEGHFWPTETRYFHGKNIRQVGDPAYFGCEFDKVCGTIFIEDSYFRSNVTQAGGFDRVILERCKCDEATLLSPRNLEIKNCILRGNSSPTINTVMLGYGPAMQNIRRAVIENITFIKSAANASDSAINMFSPQSLTIAAMSGNNIVVPIVTNFRDINAQKVYTMEAGFTRMFKTGGAKKGKVTAITFDATYNNGLGAFIIAGSWGTNANAPAVGEVWKWYSTSEIIDLGGHSNVANINPLFGGDGLMRSAGVSISGKIRTVRLTVKHFALSGADVAVALGGKIIDVDVIVSKPDTSTDANRTLYILDGDRGNSDISTINLKRLGRRFVNEFTTNGSQPGDTLASAKCGLWIDTLRFQFRNAFANPADISEGSLPEFEIIIRWIE